MNGYTEILRKLLEAGVRFVLIGVGGANYYARSGGSLFATQDRDLFLPPDAQNLLACWRVFLAGQWELFTVRKVDDGAERGARGEPPAVSRQLGRMDEDGGEIGVDDVG